MKNQEVSIPAFLTALRSDPDRLTRFRNYLLRKKQSCFEGRDKGDSNQRLQKICSEANLKPQSLIRVLNRDSSPRSSVPITEENLRRHGYILNIQAGKLITDFLHNEQTIQLHGSGLLELANLKSPESFVLPSNTRISGNSGATYIIAERLTKSAIPESESYKALTEVTGESVFIKTMHFDLPQSISISSEGELNNRIARFMKLFQREQVSLERLKGIAGAVKLRDFGYIPFKIALTSTPIIKQIPFLVQEYIEAGDLYHYFHDEVKTFKGIENGGRWTAIVRHILEIVRKFHLLGIRHGDLRPENILLGHNDDIWICDFGESLIVKPSATSSTPYRKGRTVPERRIYPKMPVEVAEDIYHLGLTMFWLASGMDAEPYEESLDNELKKMVPDFASTRYEDIDDSYKTSAVQSVVFKHIHPRLLEFNEGVGHTICQCLRHDPLKRASDADDVLRTLEVFESLRGRSQEPNISFAEEIKAFSSLKTSLRKLEGDNRLFHDLLRVNIRRLLSHMDDVVKYKRVQVAGTRDDIITTSLSYLANLSAGDRFLTMTTPSFWSDRNLGIKGRFLDANRLIASRGVVVRRIFIITEKEAKDAEDNAQDDFRKIALAQQEVIDNLLSQGIPTDDNSLSGAGYYVGVIVVKNEEERQQYTNVGYHIGLVEKKGMVITLSFHPDADKLIRKISVWSIDDSTASLWMSRMAGLLGKAVPINQYIQK